MAYRPELLSQLIRTAHISVLTIIHTYIHTYIHAFNYNLIVPHLQKKVQQCITIKTTDRAQLQYSTF